MHTTDDQPERPLAVTLVWVYCACALLLALACLILGMIMVAAPEVFDPGDDELALQIGGGVIVFFGLLTAVFHAVPFFLTPRPRMWSYVNGLLITGTVVLGIGFTPFLIATIPLFILWSRDDVKRYCQIVRPRRAYRDEGWDEAWDEPGGSGRR